MDKFYRIARLAKYYLWLDQSGNHARLAVVGRARRREYIEPVLEYEIFSLHPPTRKNGLYLTSPQRHRAAELLLRWISGHGMMYK